MQKTGLSSFDFLSGGGEMGERIRNFDWSKTPLGDPEQWDSSLKTCVRIMLTSSQPVWIGWGKELIKLYNDPYRAIAGGKHPEALGQPASVVWKDIWNDIAPMLQQVMEKNVGTYVESQLLIMERHGYPEETYYTFSYSPIPDSDGNTAGMICYNTPDTERIINERSLDTLRKLGALTQKKTLAEAYEEMVSVLGENKRDFPFVVISSIDAYGLKAKTIASNGIEKNHPLIPASIDLKHPPENGQAMASAVAGNQLVMVGREEGWPQLPTGAWNVPPNFLVHVPISAFNKKYPVAVLTLGLNPYRKFDEAYRNFVQLVADQLSLEAANIMAYEEERKKAEALFQIDKSKTVFFSNISHEFRTPLTLVLGPLEEVIHHSHNMGEDEKQNLTVAHRNAVRLLRLVNSLLDFSRIESGRQKIRFSLVDLVAYTRNLTASFRSTIERAGLQFVVKADTIVQPVYVDKQMWEKIIFNLLSNAFKFTLQGKITVDISSSPNYAIVKISDTGTGIPPEELEHIFERFHRTQSTGGRSFEGSGIGLSLTKELVQLHNGIISVESNWGEGSTFTVKIPFGKDHLSKEQMVIAKNELDEMVSGIYLESELAMEENSLFEPYQFKPEPNKFTVLIADDNSDMREYLRNLLSKKFNTITANNGMDALHKLHRSKPDLVLSDIMMPIMDGIGLLKEIKKNSLTSHIPVILLTARAGEESRIEGWDTGADDYLVKPFSAKELLARVTSQLQTSTIRLNAQKNLYNIIQQAPVAMTLLKGEHFIVEIANDQSLSIWGKKQSQVLHRPFLETLEAELAEELEPILTTVYRQGTRYHSEEKSVSFYSDEKTENRFFVFTYEPLRNAAGEVDSILIAGVDVTDMVVMRQKAEHSGF